MKFACAETLDTQNSVENPDLNEILTRLGGIHRSFT
jgi:hypothetical protein